MILEVLSNEANTIIIALISLNYSTLIIEFVETEVIINFQLTLIFINNSQQFTLLQIMKFIPGGKALEVD